MKSLSLTLLLAAGIATFGLHGCKRVAAEAADNRYTVAFDDVDLLREGSEVTVSGVVIGYISTIETDRDDEVVVGFTVLDRHTDKLRVGSILYIDGDGPTLAIENCRAERRRARRGHRYEGHGTLGTTSRKALCSIEEGWKTVKDFFD